MDPIVVAVIALAPVGCLVLGFFLARRNFAEAMETVAQAHAKEREATHEEIKRLTALLKDAQHKITAKDLNGYMALRSMEEPQTFPLDSLRSDEQEAAIEERRQAILERNKQFAGQP